MELKRGILLVAFGTSVPSGNVALNNIYSKVKINFPNIEVRWAYTSTIIRKKLSKNGTIIDSPLEALSKMVNDGFTHVVVQSMHTVPGIEYNRLSKEIECFADELIEGQKIKLGRPLLYLHSDIEAVVDAMIANFPKRNKGDAILLMGHGTSHFSNIFYPALNYYFAQKANLVFMSTVEGFPTIHNTIEELKQQQVKKVYLMPFVSVAGNHVKNDMCGEDKSSWFNLLLSNGFKVESILKGTGELDEIVLIWIDRLKEELGNLKL